MNTDKRYKPCSACGSRDGLLIKKEHEYCSICGFRKFKNYHFMREWLTHQGGKQMTIDLKELMEIDFLREERHRLIKELEDSKQKVKEAIDKICNKCSCYDSCKEHCVLGEFKQNMGIE